MTIEIGTAGGAEQRLDAETLPPLLAGVAGHQQWLPAAVATEVARLVDSPIVYVFDSVKELRNWLLVELVTGRIDTMLRDELAHVDQGAVLDFLEIERVRFANSGQFVFMGQEYRVTRDAPDHHYVSRGGRSVSYNAELTAEKAAEIVNALVGCYRAPGSADALDEFVCAFFAETTRWRREHVFNLLAVWSGSSEAITGDGGMSLPMTSGTTWEPDYADIGAQTPRRAVHFAQSVGLMSVVEQEYPEAASAEVFLNAVCGHYL